LSAATTARAALRSDCAVGHTIWDFEGALGGCMAETGPPRARRALLYMWPPAVVFSAPCDFFYCIESGDSQSPCETPPRRDCVYLCGVCTCCHTYQTRSLFLGQVLSIKCNSAGRTQHHHDAEVISLDHVELYSFGTRIGVIDVLVLHQIQIIISEKDSCLCD